jgi:Major Facilitator Superfamily
MPSAARNETGGADERDVDSVAKPVAKQARLAPGCCRSPCRERHAVHGRSRCDDHQRGVAADAHGASHVDRRQQWVVNAYALTFAGFLMLGGRAADLLGRKRVFLIGLAGFTLFSFLGGLAQSSGELIAARAAQGVGGAVLAPASLAGRSASSGPRSRHTRRGSWSLVCPTRWPRG